MESRNTLIGIPHSGKGKKLFWRTGEYGVQVDVTVLFCAWCGFALPRLVRPCADWCGTAQTGAALRRLGCNRRTSRFRGPQKCGSWSNASASIDICIGVDELPVSGIRKSANPDRTPAPQLRSADFRKQEIYCFVVKTRSCLEEF